MSDPQTTTEEKLLEFGSDTQKLAAQTLNYIKQQVHSGERKKGIAMGRLQELERMIKHLQNEKLNLEAHLLTLGDKYGQDDPQTTLPDEITDILCDDIDLEEEEKKMTKSIKVELIRCSALVFMAFAAAGGISLGISLGMTYGMSHWKPAPASMEYRNVQLLSCQARCKADWMTP